jgi:hypothetical protein
MLLPVIATCSPPNSEATHTGDADPIAEAVADASAQLVAAAPSPDAGAAPELTPPIASRPRRDACAKPGDDAWAYFLVGGFDTESPWDQAARARAHAALYQSFERRDGVPTWRGGEALNPDSDEWISYPDRDVLGIWARELRQALFLALGEGDEPSNDFFAAHVTFSAIRALHGRSEDDHAYEVTIDVARGGGGARAWNSTVAHMTLHGRVESKQGFLAAAHLVGDMHVTLPVDSSGTRWHPIVRRLRFDLARACALPPARGD